MPERGGDEPFSNPLAPTDGGRRYSEEGDLGTSAANLTNEDFRKLLMTPKPGGSSEAPTSSISRLKKSMPVDYDESSDKKAMRRKKKSFYAKIKKEEMEKQAELALKYRDRARERRDGLNKDYEETEMINTTANYRAVAPNAISGDTAANRRRQVIEESKYLGGDMEHTHLVKGLDYALLQKVKAEITCKDDDEDDELESAFHKEGEKSNKEMMEEPTFRTRMARNVCRTLFHSRPAERNELFLPGRMAYVFDLEDDLAETDVPTTIIRSKADCPNLESHATLTTNDIVINKLTQILSYLRQGVRGKKLKKKEKGVKTKEEKTEAAKPPLAEENIFGEVGDYVPTLSKQREKREKKSSSSGGGGTSYFEKPVDEEPSEKERRESVKELVKSVHHKYGGRESGSRGKEGGGRAADKGEENWGGWGVVPGSGSGGRHHAPPPDPKGKGRRPSKEDKERGYGSHHTVPPLCRPCVSAALNDCGLSFFCTSLKSKGKHKKGKTDKDVNYVPDSYAECYPGAAETADALIDSDEEVDYSKMDLGNKKGPIGRWDFDSQNAYERYMNTREAMPKAAFQFGVKMSDGRKTRRTGGEKTEKQKLDQQWQKISRILTKRKADESKDGGDHSRKNPKY